MKVVLYVLGSSFWELMSGNSALCITPLFSGTGCCVLGWLFPPLESWKQLVQGEAMTLTTSQWPFPAVWCCLEPFQCKNNPSYGVFFCQLLSTKLPHCKENVCLAYGQDWSVYAVGSQSHVSFLDPRQPAHTIKSVSSRERGSGEWPVTKLKN